MRPSTLQSHLIDEAARLKTAVAAAGPDTAVPTCPEWTVADLFEHVTEVYDYVIMNIRLLREPNGDDDRPRSGSPSERFDAALAELLGVFDDRGPGSLAHTWYGPDQSVGFWMRRMPCETVVHRADAEIAAGRPIGEIDQRFALDAVEEFLTVMLAWGTRAYREDLAEVLAEHDGLTLALVSGPRSWSVRIGSGGAELTEGADGPVRATVTADPGTLLMWLWRRLPADALETTGDAAAAAAFHELVAHLAD